MPNSQPIELVKNEPAANSTMAFYFRKPKEFSFRAGQYIDMTIPKKLDANDPDNIRSFSIASAPYENELLFAMRMRKSKFKQTLKKLNPGNTVDIQGPLGEFTLPHSSAKPLVFIAGGIGVTPFFSMIKQAAYEKQAQPITLFYSNRTRNDAPFLEKFYELQQKFPFTFIPVFTRQGDGYINEQLLKKQMPDITHSVYYIAGPPAMVGAMQRLLYTINISPNNLRLDEFTGY